MGFLNWASKKKIFEEQALSQVLDKAATSFKSTITNNYPIENTAVASVAAVASSRQHDALLKTTSYTNENIPPPQNVSARQLVKPEGINNFKVEKKISSNLTNSDSDKVKPAKATKKKKAVVPMLGKKSIPSDRRKSILDIEADKLAKINLLPSSEKSDLSYSLKDLVEQGRYVEAQNFLSRSSRLLTDLIPESRGKSMTKEQRKAEKVEELQRTDELLKIFHVPSLVHILSSPNTSLEIKHVAAHFLAEMSLLENKKMSTALLESKTVECLEANIRRMAQSNEKLAGKQIDYNFNLVRAVRNLFAHSLQAVTIAVQSNICSDLEKIFRSSNLEHPAIYSEAAGAFANIIGHGKEFYDSIAEYHLAAASIFLLSKAQHDDIRYQLTTALADLALEKRFHGEIYEYFGSKVVLRTISEAKDFEVIAEGARMINNMASTSKNRRQILDIGNYLFLIHWVKTTFKEDVKDVALLDVLRALTNLSAEQDFTRVVLEHEVPGALLNLIQNREKKSEVRQQSLRFLTVLTESGSKPRGMVLKAIRMKMSEAGNAGLPTQPYYELQQKFKQDDENLKLPENMRALTRATHKYIGSPLEATLCQTESSEAESCVGGGGVESLKTGDYESSQTRKTKGFRPDGRIVSMNITSKMDKHVFEVGQVLGRGAYGTVYMARNTETNRLYAIKQFHAGHIDEKVIKEQKIWEGLNHENIVSYEGCFIGDQNDLNLVIEYVDGWSLADHLSQFSAFPESLVVEITRQILDGLEYLHEHGIIHRDMKPANILVSQEGQVKITDFGVSTRSNGTTMVGTPWYIAPEMVRNQPQSAAVDIWSVGCTVLELISGKRPYHELGAMAALLKMVNDGHPPIPMSLSEECRGFIRSCWISDANKRPTAKELKKHSFLQKRK